MIFRWIAQIIYTCLLFIETVIAIRFVFLMFDANARNFFVNWIYKLGEFFVQPFSSIVDANWRIGNFRIDVDSLIALFIYMIFAFIAIEIIKAFSSRPVV